MAGMFGERKRSWFLGFLVCVSCYVLLVGVGDGDVAFTQRKV